MEEAFPEICMPEVVTPVLKNIIEVLCREGSSYSTALIIKALKANVPRIRRQH